MQIKIFNYFKKNTFIKRVGILVGGSVAGQLIAFISLPFLTRLYGPDAFSALAVYTSIIILLSGVTTLSYEYAIPIPKNDQAAASLLVISVTLAIITFGILSSLLILYEDQANDILKNQLSGALWLLPLGVLCSSLYNSLQYWSTRKKKYGLIAKTRLTQSITGTSVKFLLVNNNNENPITGLLLGQLIMQSAGFINLLYSLLKNDLKKFQKISLKKIRYVLIAYVDFPKYTTFSILANNAGIQLPILLIAYNTETAEAGYLMIAMQLLSIPMSLVGNAISQVYFAEGSDKYHKGELKAFTNKITNSLIKASLLPIFLVMLAAPYIIPFFLGPEWERTGILMSWMAPWFFMQFITTPISTALYITKNQKIALVLQISGLIIRLGSLFAAGLFLKKHTGEIYAIASFGFYIIYFLIIKRILNKPKTH